MFGNKYDKKELKQVILVRADLKLPPGKLAAQAAHASVDAVLSSHKKLVKAWRDQGMKKVVLKVKDEKELKKYINEARLASIEASVITDAGRTVVAPGTVTCGAIGPAPEGQIDKITGELKIM